MIPPYMYLYYISKTWHLTAPDVDLPMELTLSRPLGRIRPKRIHLGIPLISPRRLRVSAGLHAADTLRHTQDDHGSRQSGLCPNR